MVLDSNTADGDSIGLQLLYKRDFALGLGLVLQVVVVVKQLHLRIGLVRELKGLFNVIGADDFVPLRLAQRAIFVERFVDYIPALNPALVAADDCVDMIFHAREKGVAVEKIAFVVVKDPVWNLIVPDQIVT